MTRILALDPGGTTGWALYQGGAWDLLQAPNAGVKLGQIGPHEHHLDLYEFIETEIDHDFLIVYEGFEYRQGQRTTVNLISREYIGVVKLIAQDRKVRAIKQSTGIVIPGPKNNAFWTDDKIKRLGLWWPGHPHAMDALRHLLYYQAFTKNDTQLLQRLK